MAIYYWWILIQSIQNGKDGIKMGTRGRGQEFRDQCEVCKHKHCPGICGKCAVYSEDLNGCACIRIPTQAELDFKKCKYFEPCAPKFKVGDKVRFIHNITPNIEAKDKWIGRVFTIDNVLPFGSGALKDWPYGIREAWVVHEPELELYEENKKEKEPMEKKISRNEKFARQCETCAHDSAHECRTCDCEECICNTEDNGCQCNEWASPMELEAGKCAYYKKTEDKIKVTMTEIHAVFGIDKDVKIYIADSVKEGNKIYEDHVAKTFKVDCWKPINAHDDHTLAFQLVASGFNKAGKHVISVFYPRVEITFNPKDFGNGGDHETTFYRDNAQQYSFINRTFLKTLYPDCPLTVKPDSGTFDGVEYKYAYYVTKETEPFRVIYTDDLKRKFGGDVEIVPVKLQRAKLDDFYKGDRVIYIGDNGVKGPQKGDIGTVILNDHHDVLPIACQFPDRQFYQTIDGVNGWWCNPEDLAKICEDQNHFEPGDMVIMMDEEGTSKCYPKKFTIGTVRRITNYPDSTSPSLLIEWPEGSVIRNSLTGDYTWACTARHVMKIRKVGQDK